MIADRFARGIRAEGFEGPSPPPSAGTAGWLSGAPIFGIDGVQLVASRGQYLWSTFRMIYLTNPWVYGAVNMIAGTIARMPLRVYATDPTSGDPVLQRSDWPVTIGRPSGAQSLDALLKRPYGYISRQAMVKSMLIDRLVAGNGLWEIMPGGPGQLPSSLKFLPWKAVQRVIADEDGLPMIYRVAQDLRDGTIMTGKTRDLSPIDVVHFGRGDDPDLPVGVSPLVSCRNTIRLHDAVTRSVLAWFGNAMQPGGHVTVDKLTREKAREIREMIADAYASPENAGKVLVTSGKWESTQESLANSEIMSLLDASRIEVAAAFHIPPPVLGILDRAIKSNVSELRSQFVRDTVGHWTGSVEGDIDAQLLPMTPSWQNLDVDFDMAEQLQPDFEALAGALEQLGDTLSIDQRLQYLGMTPFRKPWSQVPWSKPGSVPMDEAYAQGGNPNPAAGTNGHSARRARAAVIAAGTGRSARDHSTELDDEED